MDFVESQVIESPKSATQRKYGFFTVLSMVIGVMVGSGIYVKTQSSFATTHSAILVMMGWFLISLVVLCIGWAFLEIASSTKKSGKPGAINTWGKEFISPAAGKLIGFFFVFVYFPILLSILGIFFADQMLTGIAYGLGYTSGTQLFGPWMYFLITTIIAASILGVTFGINTVSSKPGKIFQVSGTGLALFPLILVISSAVTLLIVAGHSDWDMVTMTGMTEVWNPNSEMNAGLWADVNGNGVIESTEVGQERESGMTIFKLFIACLPGIMFTLDGFIWSASLSNETKGKNTLNLALVSGIIITICIYVMMTYFTFATVATGVETGTITDTNANGSVQDEMTSSMSVAGVLMLMFPNAGAWLPIMIQIFVMIAILTTISGLYITNLRNITALAEADAFKDEQGKTFRRNKAGVPYWSGKHAAVIVFATFFILRSMDAAVYNSTDYAVSYGITGFGSDFIMLGSFSIYCLILLGGLRNRKTKQVEVDQVKGFVPCTIFSSAVVFLITVSFAFTILSPSYAEVGGSVNWMLYGFNITVAVGYCLLMLGVYYYNEKATKTLTNEQKLNKQIFAMHYHTLHTWDEIQKTVEREISLPYARKEKLVGAYSNVVEKSHDYNVEHTKAISDLITKEVKVEQVEKVIKKKSHTTKKKSNKSIKKKKTTSKKKATSKKTKTSKPKTKK